ncbi:MAG: PAS domain S-box protein [Acidobacteria bacterium]|nr:PAS domain S-box protein [Acidobacteriota bacterium]
MPSQLDLAARLAAIVETQGAIASADLDLEKIRHIVVTEVIALTGADGAVVESLRDDEILYQTAAGSLAPHVGTLFDVEGSLSGLCIRQRTMLRSDDVEGDPRVNHEITSVTGSRSIIVVPLLHHDEAIGVLKVVSTRPHHFSDLDAYSMQLLAGFVAASVAHASIYEAKALSEARFRLLFDRNIVGAFWTTTDGRILEVNDAFAALFGYEAKDDILKGTSWELHPTRADRERMLSTLREQKTITHYPLRVKKHDGSFIDVIVNIDLVAGNGASLLLGTIALR